MTNERDCLISNCRQYGKHTLPPPDDIETRYNLKYRNKAGEIVVVGVGTPVGRDIEIRVPEDCAHVIAVETVMTRTDANDVITRLKEEAKEMFNRRSFLPDIQIQKRRQCKCGKVCPQDTAYLEFPSRCFNKDGTFKGTQGNPNSAVYCQRCAQYGKLPNVVHESQINS